MTDAFWAAFFNNLSAIIGAAAAALAIGGNLYMTWRNGRRAEVSSKAADVARAGIVAQLNDVHQQTQALSGNLGADKP